MEAAGHREGMLFENDWALSTKGFSLQRILVLGRLKNRAIEGALNLNH